MPTKTSSSKTSPNNPKPDFSKQPSSITPNPRDIKASKKAPVPQKPSPHRRINSVSKTMTPMIIIRLQAGLAVRQAGRQRSRFPFAVVAAAAKNKSEEEELQAGRQASKSRTRGEERRSEGCSRQASKRLGAANSFKDYPPTPPTSHHTYTRLSFSLSLFRSLTSPSLHRCTNTTRESLVFFFFFFSFFVFAYVFLSVLQTEANFRMRFVYEKYRARFEKINLFRIFF